MLVNDYHSDSHLNIFPIHFWASSYRRDRGVVTPIKNQKEVSKYYHQTAFHVIYCIYAVSLHSVEAAGEGLLYTTCISVICHQ